MQDGQQTPTVSVVIAVKDNPDGLERTLRSLSRTDPDIPQILVIDGGSGKPTIDVINAFRRFIYYWETGQDDGIGDAFNRGIQRASGDYVAILNSGDTWTCSTHQQVLRAAVEYGLPDVLHGDIRFVRQDGESYVVRSSKAKHRRRAYLFHPALFVRRDCYEHVGLYDTSFKLAMDAEWCHRAMAYKVRFAAIESVLANMELGGVSDTGYANALREFRRSAISHKQASPLAAWCYFLMVLIGKRIRAGLRPANRS